MRILNNSWTSNLKSRVYSSIVMLNCFRKVTWDPAWKEQNPKKSRYAQQWRSAIPQVQIYCPGRLCLLSRERGWCVSIFNTCAISKPCTDKDTSLFTSTWTETFSVSIKTKVVFTPLCRIHIGLPSLVVSPVQDYIHGWVRWQKPSQVWCHIEDGMPNASKLCCPPATIVAIKIIKTAYCYAIKSQIIPIDPRL